MSAITEAGAIQDKRNVVTPVEYQIILNSAVLNETTEQIGSAVYNREVEGTGVCCALKSDGENIEPASFFGEYRDTQLGTSMCFQELLTDNDVGTQLDHNTQKPKTRESGPPNYIAHPDADATDYHFDCVTDGVYTNAIAFRIASAQDSFF